MQAVEIKTQFRPVGNLQITTRLKNTIRIMVGVFFNHKLFRLYLCWCQSLNCEIVTSIFFTGN